MKSRTPLLLLLLTGLITASNLAAAPANDNFDSAQILSGDVLQVDGTLVSSTREVGEVADGGNSGGSVWYSWTPPRNGIVGMGATFQSNLGNSMWIRLYQLNGVRSVFSVVKIASAVSTQIPAIQSVSVSRGVEYFIRVSTDYPNAFGPFTLSLAFTPIYPNNDSVAGATLLQGSTPSASGALVDASREAGEPSDTGNRTLWWKWIAPSNGTTAFSAKDSEFPAETVLSVFTGSAVTNLVPQMTQTGNPEFSLPTQAGATYFIAAGSTSATTFGTAIVKISHSPAPASGTGSGGSSVAGIKASLKAQIISLKRQLSKAKHIQIDSKRAKKIKRLQKKISRLQKQLNQL